MKQISFSDLTVYFRELNQQAVLGHILGGIVSEQHKYLILHKIKGCRSELCDASLIYGLH
ncbi:hypothetical protein D3C73_1622910 [compost metagenome]